MAGHHTHTSPADFDTRVAEVLDQLRAEGGRITSGRRAIVLALFTASDHHVTADDLADAVQVQHPDLHLSTIYRTLEALEHLGVVSRLDVGQGRAVYHLVDHAHHHLVCERCGSITGVSGEAFARLAESLRADYGFRAAPHHIAVTGRCRNCV